MLSKQRCPHTGLVNFCTDIDPFMSVGSIIETGPSRYVWRSHLVDHRRGVTTDPMSAEAYLRRGRVRALGQVAAGCVDVADDHVQLEVTLPWLLHKFAQAVQQTIAGRGRILLEKK